MLVVGTTGLVPTAQAVVCGDFTSLRQSCDLVGGVKGICVEDEFGGIYCSAQAVRNGGVNPNSLPGTSGGININFIKPYGDSIKDIINLVLIPVLIAIAFIVFLWGVYKYFIWEGASESDKADGRKYAMWGIIGFVVIFSVWALVNILMGALNLQGGKPPPIPKL